MGGKNRKGDLMGERKNFILRTPLVRSNALEAVRYAPPNYVVTVAEPTRSDPQNRKLHALLGDLAASPVKWFGKRRKLEEWKVLMISAHAVATDNRGEVIPGIEGEMVAIRESTANMGVARAASLIEYVTAFCVSNGVELKETVAGGFFDVPARDEAA
jgi:hypothetical protein